jgi:signal transduction histidine kinase
MLWRYGVPVAATLTAALLTDALQPCLAPCRLLLFLGAVVISAWYRGLQGGLLATLLGALGHVSLLPPASQAARVPDPGRWVGLALFLPLAALLSWLIGELHAARRTADELANDLRQRIAELAEAARRRIRLLDVLGHELRGPLGPLQYVSQVLSQQDSSPVASWARGVLGRQLRQLTRLADDLLESSRLAQDKVVLQRERLDAAHLVRNVLDDYTPEMDGAGVKLRRELTGDPVWVDGDSSRLAQVLCNLLHNAVKFTGRGGWVSVRLVADVDGGRALVAVRDSGVGIDPALLPHVFDAYAQGSWGPRRERGGLGLGLALVKSLVALHGGEVRACSDGPGRGAEFNFWLPLLGSEAHQAPPAAADGAGRCAL